MIRHIEGAHLTATNKRHLGQMICAGMTRGQSARLRYAVEPVDGAPGRWRYRIEADERNIWGRVQTRRHSGILEYVARPIPVA